jgi:diguanylate cyclase (GGDEF)-like protein
VDTTVLVLVLAAAVVATGLAAAAIAALLRLRPPVTRARPAGAPGREELAADVGAEPDGQMRLAIERAREEAARARQLAALYSTLDLDELLLRMLETAVGLVEADAAAIALEQETGPTLETRFGLSATESAPSLDALHGDSRARSVTLDYRYPAGESGEEPLKRGVVVPIPSAGEDSSLGALAVYWRREVGDLDDDQLATLEELARSSARAIENARRYKAVTDLAELDPLSGLYNRRYFQDTLAREVKRAQRYRRRLSLLVFDVDGLKAINDEHGHLAGDALLVETADRLRSVTRSADVASRIGGDEFAVILPESTVADAQQLHERLSRVLEAEPAGPLDRIQISAGIAELRQDERDLEFFDRADQASLKAKRRGRGRLVLGDEPDAEEASVD